jgi:hypothetical protein
VLLYPLRVLGGRSLTPILGFVHRFISDLPAEIRNGVKLVSCCYTTGKVLTCRNINSSFENQISGIN